jgi:hypothetical protein
MWQRVIPVNVTMSSGDESEELGEPVNRNQTAQLDTRGLCIRYIIRVEPQEVINAAALHRSGRHGGRD